MKQNNTRRGAAWVVLSALIVVAALAGPQSAWADSDKNKGKSGKVPVIIKTPIVTQDPEPKKK